MASMTEDNLRATAETAAGCPGGYLPMNAIPDQFDTLRHDVTVVRQHPLIGDGVLVGGFIYDVDAGLLSQHL